MPPKKKPTQLSNQEFFLMIVPVILAMLVVAFTVGLYVSQRIADNNVLGTRVSDADVVTDDTQTDNEEEEQVDDAADWESLPDLGEVSVDDGVELEVDWYTNPVDVSEGLENEDWPLVLKPDGNGSVKKYEIGSVFGIGVKYEGHVLSVIEEKTYGLGDYHNFYYVLEPLDGSGEGVLLVAESDFSNKSDIGDFWEKYFIVDYGSTIPALGSSDEVVFPSGNTFVPLAPIGFGNPSFQDYLNTELGDPIGTVNGVTLFEEPGDSNGTYLYRRPDGRIVNYAFQWPFWDDASSRDAQELTINAISDEFTGSYISNSFGGCGLGSLNITDFVTEDPARVQLLGVLDGYQIYELSESGYAEKLTALTTWLRMNEDKTADDFFALKPFLYVQDFAGNWVELTHIEVVPPAECGKPVIYLYPEEEADVLVELKLEGGFTKVDPPYNDGWRVIASPDGSLYNKDDGKTYPYLFWEGYGGAYEAPEYYWVISRDEVPKIVGKLLAEFGLNGQEIYDFMEFWVPLMQDAPYYKVGFHGTRMMDQLAPLTVTPRPNSVFRILMDYTELQEPIPANPLPQIIPFKREGFSVVEWGGVLQIEDKIQ